MTDASRRILVADDEVPVRDVLTQHFSSQGYVVESTSNSHEAVALAEHHRPDVVVLDIDLPGSDGLQILKRLRQAVPSSEIIITLGNHDVWRARETVVAGAFDCVEDPLDVQRLDDVVSAALSHVRAHDVRQRLRYTYLTGFACLATLGGIVFEVARRHLMSVSWFAGIYFVLMRVALVFGFYAVARAISLEPPKSDHRSPDRTTQISR